VFQSYALFPHLTAGENIAIALGHLSATEHDARTRALLARVHLDGLQNRRPTTLSGGQQQRVALARALAREPSALLLDEPFSAVDQVTRRKLRLELASLTRDLHLPIILVTHDLNEAAMLADRLCVLHGGHTLQSGTPEEVMNHPRNATVASLMDALNLFEGKVLEHSLTRGSTRLAWYDHVFEVRLHQDFPPGSQVHWMIPPGGVLLHRRHRPASRGEGENPLSGVITELLTNRGLSTVIMRITAQKRPYLTLELPPHVVRRNNLRIGERINVSLVGDTVHLMPWQPTARHE
jgi:molybdate transport system ATP-binding protein